MVLDMKQMVIELEQRRILSLEDALGTRIDCQRGRLWVTEYRSPDDVVLEAGESYELSRAGAAVVQALRGALFVLQAPAVSTAGAELNRSLTTRSNRARSRDAILPRLGAANRSA